METVKVKTKVDQINKVFQAQKANQFKVGNTTISQRKKKLKALKKAIEVTYRQDIRDALKADSGKPQVETDLTEVYPIVSELKHAISKIHLWMRKESVSTPLSMVGSSSYIKYEPKGVCLIISPWNLPFNLTFSPLISAIAAGNTVIIKPSEMTPHSSALMSKIIKDLFDENEIALFEGAIETSTTLLNLPFNHIFFTGAPSIGKIVMTAAAKNLTSVTLELGGKSPTIVDETASVSVAAKRIAWGKFINCGQFCIAPDHVYVHHKKVDQFIEAVKKNIETFYGKSPIQSDDYAESVNQRHYKRVLGYIEDSVSKGAKIVYGGKSDPSNNTIQPTIVTNVPVDSALMENEIFGPVLPIIPFTNLDEVIDNINAGEKPLALYIYSKSKKNINKISNNTRAGGTCINNNVIYFSNNNLPFGGSNNSGIGKSHGEFGFKAFSNARGFYKQHIPGALELLMPPYTNFKETLMNLTIKWF